MNKALYISFLAAFIAVAVAQHKIRYRCQANSIAIIVDEEVGVSIASVYSTSGNKCLYATDGSTVTIPVLNAGTPISPLPCGVSHDTSDLINKPKVYGLVLKTSTCPDLYCIQEKDVLFSSITCDFIEAPSEMITVNGIQVDGEPSTGTVAEADVVIVMTAHKQDGSQITAADTLGLLDKMRLRAVLTKSDFVKGIRLTECKATDFTDPSLTLPLYDTDGCFESAAPFITGSFSMTTQTTADFTTECPLFGVFLFTAGPGTMEFSCKATYCNVENEAKCANSCVLARKRREAREVEGEKEVRVVVRISTDANATTSTVNNGQGVQTTCNHRIYVIGLVILGCVLVLTVIVTIGMFIGIKRRRYGNDVDKMAYINNGMS